MTPHDEERLRVIRERRDWFHAHESGSCEIRLQIANDIAEDQLYLTDDLVPRLVAEIARLNGIVDQITAVRFSPIGDNHHNAAVCPYCRGEVQDQIAAAHRSALLEAETSEVGGTAPVFGAHIREAIAIVKDWVAPNDSGVSVRSFTLLEAASEVRWHEDNCGSVCGKTNVRHGCEAAVTAELRRRAEEKQK